MSKKRNEIPVPEPKPDKFELPSASRVEMTGLVPTPDENEHLRNSYGDIPTYLADDIRT